MKVLFLGTPRFAATVLEALYNSDNELSGVVSQPDTALKRGKVEKSAVTLFCDQNGITLLQPERVRDAIPQIKALGAEIAVTAAYGQILDRNFLDAFKYGVINVHASLLPKYRGASPIYSAILNGERVTGITIMRTELGLDTGDILAVSETPISETDTADTLTERLANIGAQLLLKTLGELNNIRPVEQDDSLATVCRTVKKSETYIDFNKPSDAVCRQVRALSSEPCARTIINGEVYKVYYAKPAERAGYTNDKANDMIAPGTVLCSKDRLTVACAVGAIEITSIQAPGKRRMDAAEFLRGKKLPVGVVCESSR